MTYSSDEDFPDHSDKEIFSASTQLYRFLSERLGHIASGIRYCLEFVSNCILYMLGMNSKMFLSSGSGDAYGAHHKIDVHSYARFHKQTRKSKSCCDCVQNDQCRYHSHNTTSELDSFPEKSVSTNEMYRDTDCVSDEKHDSKDDLLGESGNDADTSDAESQCCFGVKRLKKLVKHKSKHNERYKSHKLHHRKQPSNDIKIRCPNFVASATTESKNAKISTEDIISKDKKCSVEEKADSLQLQCLPVSDKRTRNTKQQCKTDLLESTKARKESCTEVVTKAAVETSKPEEKLIRHSPKSSFTKTKTDQSPTHLERDIGTARKLTKPDVKDKSENIVSLSSATTSCMQTGRFKIGVSSTSNSTVFKVAERQLAKWEENNLIRAFNCEIDREKQKREKINRLEIAKRVYCITTQAIRQKMKRIDTNYTEKIHACRRYIKNYVLSRSEDAGKQFRSFKLMIESYKNFKRYAAESKYDISHFIQKVRQEDDIMGLISSDKPIVYDKQRLKESDILLQNEEHVPFISNLFQENKPCTKRKDVDDTNDAKAKKEIQSYLTQLCGENLGGNESFTAAVESLSEHFTKLVHENGAFSSTVNKEEREDPKPNKALFKPFDFQITHYNTNPFSYRSPSDFHRPAKIPHRSKGKRTSLKHEGEEASKEKKETMDKFKTQQSSKSVFGDTPLHAENKTLVDKSQIIPVEVPQAENTILAQTIQSDNKQKETVATVEENNCGTEQCREKNENVKDTPLRPKYEDSAVYKELQCLTDELARPDTLVQHHLKQEIKSVGHTQETSEPICATDALTRREPSGENETKTLGKTKVFAYHNRPLRPILPYPLSLSFSLSLSL